MVLISLQAVNFDYGREPLLSAVDLTILPGVKYALVGANGAGKTTLLAVLSGELTPAGGQRQVAGKIRVAKLHQEAILETGGSEELPLFDAVVRAAFTTELELEAELQELAQRLSARETLNDPQREELVQRQGRLQAEFERRGGYTMRPRVEATMYGVGLSRAFWSLPCGRLSGGERRRAALAAILLSDADVLLLDEPTNHLDLEACEWLEGFLGQYRGAAVLVSHDRQFLDRIAGTTLHLEGGIVTAYSGNYSFFARAYAQRIEQVRLAYQRQQERIRQTEDFIRRNIAGQKTKQAQSRRKQLQREVRLIQPPADPATMRLHLQPQRPSGGMVLQADRLSKQYGGRYLFRDFDLRLSRGERLGIIGPNGCGKSTMLKILSGREPPDGGSVRRGYNVDLGLYDQELRSVADHHTVLEEMAAVDPAATLGELRTFLGAFGFTADMVDRPVGKLSGGERGRLALLRLIKQGYNTLLLDEPTNHLDVRAREALEEALADYRGTLVVVSHDRRFLDKIIGRLLVFGPGEAENGGETENQLSLYLGNYSDYRAQLAKQPGAIQESSAPDRVERMAQAVSAERRAQTLQQGPPPRPLVLSKNEIARRRRWITRLEDQIADLEREREMLLATMSDPNLPAARRVELGHRCTAIAQDIAGKLSQWEEWHLEIEGASE